MLLLEQFVGVSAAGSSPPPPLVWGGESQLIALGIRMLAPGPAPVWTQLCGPWEAGVHNPDLPALGS